MTRKTAPSTGRLDSDTIRAAVLNKSIADGTITADQREAWDRLLKTDLHGSIEELNKLAEQRRAVNAAVRRGNPDEISARAASEGRFAPERAAFWRRELDRDPVGTERLLIAAPEEGGLVPCRREHDGHLVAGYLLDGHDSWIAAWLLGHLDAGRSRHARRDAPGRAGAHGRR
jgi:hypothetical protein